MLGTHRVMLTRLSKLSNATELYELYTELYGKLHDLKTIQYNY